MNDLAIGSHSIGAVNSKKKKMKGTGVEQLECFVLFLKGKNFEKYSKCLR